MTNSGETRERKTSEGSEGLNLLAIAIGVLVASPA